MIPNKYYLEITTLMMAVLQFGVFVLYYCNKGGQIIFGSLIFVLRVMLPVLQSQEQTGVLQQMISAVMGGFLFFLVLNAAAIFITYV